MLRDTAGLYQTFQEKTPSILGIRAEELPEMRQMSFTSKMESSPTGISN